MINPLSTYHSSYSSILLLKQKAEYIGLKYFLKNLTTIDPNPLPHNISILKRETHERKQFAIKFHENSKHDTSDKDTNMNVN
jgi:hypothetical protein